MAYVTRLNQGYMDGLYNREINPELSNRPGSEYDEGYLVGSSDREAMQAAGTNPPKLLGFYEESDLPIKKGQEVIIKKGTVVKVIGREPKPAGRTYKIKVNHVGCGNTFYIGHNFNKEYIRPTPPVVVWAGPGGLWASADMNDFL